MSFDSPFFLCFFLPITALVYTLLPNRMRKWHLLGVSLLFCSFGSFTGAAVLTVNAACTYLLCGRSGKGTKILGIILNLCLLSFYKYFCPAGLMAPVGISFFTFRCISYLADGRKADSFSSFLLYAVFFPQLTAGPIARCHQFLLNTPDAEEAALGFRRFLWGMAKKLLLVFPLSKIVVSAYSSLNFSNAWLGALGYMLQIFLDFSAYSDMAIGLSQFFGVHAPENFNAPYLAVSITDFWRRWHMSLSHWFRDYVYIPLGGSRKGKKRAAFNKLLVFALCGIWHGNGWTFLVWGLWHGLLAAVETLYPPKTSFLSRLYTLLAVCIGFVVFQADSLQQAFRILYFMVIPSPAAPLILDLRQIVVLSAAVLLCFPVDRWLHRQEEQVTWLKQLSYVLTLLLLVVCLGAIAANGFQPFIYAQF